MTLAKTGRDPKVPAYAGGKLPLTTHLADRVRHLLAEPSTWHRLPPQVGEWLAAQARRSVLTAPDELLVETFARGARHYLVAYCFAGRNAHQTLGMLLTRRMERRGLRPQGFVASDYCIATWGLEPDRRRRGAVRRRHPGRRSRGVDGRELADQADLPQLRGGRRA